MKEAQFENILRQALCPEIAPDALIVHDRMSGKGNHMNIKQFIKKTCLAAAVILLLTTTVYAADGLNIKTLLSGNSSRTYASVEQAEEKAGFEMDAVERFTNGYAFDGAYVGETKALDEKDKVRLTYNEIHVDLCNAAGEALSLIAHQHQDGIEASELPPEQVRQIGEVTLEYRLHHYKLVPADYVQTEKDKAMLQQPGYFMSYGSKSIEESDVAFLNWEKDGICYTLMDTDGSETAESLFSMAKELILSGK